MINRLYFIETKVDVRFSPNGTCKKFIIESIDAAKKEIFVQAFAFTSAEIANSLINASKRGVAVTMLVDRRYKHNLLVVKMSEQFPIYVDNPAGIAHNKVMIIDDDVVITGSYNFTESAERRNAENIIRIRNKDIANIYKKEWQRRKVIKTTYLLKIV